MLERLRRPAVAKMNASRAPACSRPESALGAHGRQHVAAGLKESGENGARKIPPAARISFCGRARYAELCRSVVLAASRGAASSRLVARRRRLLASVVVAWHVYVVDGELAGRVPFACRRAVGILRGKAGIGRRPKTAVASSSPRKCETSAPASLLILLGRVMRRSEASAKYHDALRIGQEGRKVS